jgi:predicted transcriptional regulator
MKVSVSLPDDDVHFLDDLAAARGSSRSAGLHQAIDLLRSQQLSPSYADAWDEWHEAGGAADWDATTADGLGGHERGDG